MRKIFASLFVIAAVLGIGVFATGAYFTDTVTQSNLTFRTSNADLKMGICTGCSRIARRPTQTWTASTLRASMSPSARASPIADCMVLQNTGAYALNLTGGIASYTQSPSSMHDAFMVKAQLADATCNPTGAVRLRLPEPEPGLQRLRATVIRIPGTGCPDVRGLVEFLE